MIDSGGGDPLRRWGNDLGHWLRDLGRRGALGEEPHPQRAQVRKEIHRTAAFTLPFAVMNVLATVIACYGLLADSTAVVIGAMIVAMLLGPITGIALALVDGDGALLRRALTAEVGGALLVLGVSAAIGALNADMPLTHEMLVRTRPNVLDLMIALAGGAAGAYATVSPRLGVGLVGVAISTALVPPLSTCGLCLARGLPHLAWGGFLLFVTNLVAIQFASSAVMWLHGFHRVTRRDPETDRRTRSRLLMMNGVSFTVLTLLAATMGINFNSTLAQQGFEAEVRERLEAALAAYPGVHLSDLSFQHGADRETVVAVLRTPASFSPDRVRALEDRLPRSSGKRVDLVVMSVIVKEATRDGYLYRTGTESETAPSPAGTEPMPFKPLPFAPMPLDPLPDGVGVATPRLAP